MPKRASPFDGTIIHRRYMSSYGTLAEAHEAVMRCHNPDRAAADVRDIDGGYMVHFFSTLNRDHVGYAYSPNYGDQA